MTAYFSNITAVQTVLVNASGGFEKLYGVDRAVAELAAAGVLDVAIQTTAPGSTAKLWFDNSAAPGTLKHHNGAAWVAVASPAAIYKHIHNNGFNNYAASAAPTVGDDIADGYAVGSMWFDTTADRAYVALDVTAGAAVWLEITRQGDFRADGSVAMTGNLNLNGNDLLLDTDGNTYLHSPANDQVELMIGGASTITGNTSGLTVPAGKSLSITDAPTAANQAANKAYVDSLVNGLSWIATPALVATTGPGTLATSFAAGQTVDGVVLSVGDIILIKDQASGVENGIYTVTAGAPTRTASLAAGSAAANKALFVQRGTDNADKGFTCTNDSGSDIVGTDALVFGQFASATATPTFLTIATPAGTSPVADVASDTLTFTNTGGIAITGNAATDTIDIALDLTGLTALGAAPDGADTLIIRDTSAGVNKSVLFSDVLSGVPSYTTIVPTTGTNPVATANGETLTFTASQGGVALAGTAASDTLDLRPDIPSLTDIGAGNIAGADSFMVYDASASAHRRVSFTDLVAQASI